MQTEAIILSNELSPKWARIGRSFATTHSAAISRHNGNPESILALAVRLAPCVLVLQEDVADKLNRDDLSQVLGESIRLLVEVKDSDLAREEAFIRMGCAGVVSCSAAAAEALRALKTVAEGELWISGPVMSNLVRKLLWESKHHLTIRESEILALVELGLKNDEIGERLFISPQTVRWHLRGLYAKIGIHDRAKVVSGSLVPMHRARTAQLG